MSVSVEVSKLPEVANATPVGIDDVPYAPEWLYILACAYPVGKPFLFKYHLTWLKEVPSPAKDCPCITGSLLEGTH